MKLFCDDKLICLRTDVSEKNSMLVTGGSRMGKTFFVSNLAADLILKENIIQLIDLGDKWSKEDKSRLLAAGAIEDTVEKQGLKLIFASITELSGCAKSILNALGLRSYRAEAVLKKALSQQYSRKGNSLSIKNIIKFLADEKAENGEEQDKREEICSCLISYGIIPDITFCVDTNTRFSNSSVVWNLSGLDDTYVRISTYLIMYCIYCEKKRDFKNNARENNVFVVIDECQNLEFDRRSIIGTCLAEGQKYGLNLILITQFLKGNFSEAIIAQFKQGGFRFHFRTTEEEAATISGQLAFDSDTRKKLFQNLVSFPNGNCLFYGPHSIGKGQAISENLRFIKVIGDGPEEIEREHILTVAAKRQPVVVYRGGKAK